MMRALAVAVVVAGVVAVWAAMAAGWRRRAAAQSDLPEPLPADPGEAGDSGASAPGADAAEQVFEGVYVSTTRHGQYLERIVAHGLGTRSRVRVRVRPDGVTLERPGARSFRIPAGDLRGVGRSSGMIGKFVERDGLVVITWALGESLLDTGIRTDRAAGTAALVAAVAALGPHETPSRQTSAGSEGVDA